MAKPRTNSAANSIASAAKPSAAKGFLVVFVTCGSRKEAEHIAGSVVEARLAACVNILDTPVRSVYRWKGKVERAREFLLIIKSSRKRLAPLRAEIQRLHSYEVPEFIALPIVAGSQPYLTWLEDSLNARGTHP